jgi:hypothetical protein
VSAAEQVQVDVKHCLPCMTVAVEHGAVAGMIDATILGDACGLPDHRPNYGIVIGGEVIQRRNVTLGNDEDMYRGFRLDVLERQQLVVFVHAFRGNFSSDNLAKQARHEGEYSRSAAVGEGRNALGAVTQAAT